VNKVTSTNAVREACVILDYRGGSSLASRTQAVQHERTQSLGGRIYGGCEPGGSGGLLGLDSEQVVRADDVEALDYRRPIRPAIELLVELHVLGDRRSGILDAVGQLDHDHERRAVCHPRRGVTQALGTHAIERREQVALRSNHCALDRD
jgi:hypothetical protein